MKDCPHCLVRADLQGPLQTQRRDPVFAGSKMPTDGKPNRKGMRVRSKMVPASVADAVATASKSTHEPAVPKPPSSRMIAGRAQTAAARPSQPFQVVQAICISREPARQASKLPKRLGVVNAGMGTFHCPSLAQLRLNGSPELSYLCDFPNCGFLQLHLGINIHLPDASRDCDRTRRHIHLFRAGMRQKPPRALAARFNRFRSLLWIMFALPEGVREHCKMITTCRWMQTTLQIWSPRADGLAFTRAASDRG